MEKIKLNTIALDGYDEKYKDFVFEISNGNSKSIFVHNIKERIDRSLNKDYFEFECGYVVLNENQIPIGYVFVSGLTKDELYLEYSVLSKERKKGYGVKILTEVSDFLFSKFNIKQIKLDIDFSNYASIKTAESSGFLCEDDSLFGRVLFCKENEQYINKLRKK